MINGIIFDERLNTARDWGNIFKKAFPTDGVISGFDITGTGAMFTIAPGYIVMCGRVINNDGIMTVDNTATLQNGYVRLKYRIDLNAAPSREDFSQGSFVIDTSGSPIFPSLLQENINGTGKVYEVELAVFQMTGGAISSRVRMMPPAGLDVLYVFGEGGGYFSVRREGGLTRLAVRGSGGAEIAALNIDDAGALSTFGALTVGAGLSVGGDIAQNAGKAQLNEAITLNGKNGYALTMRWVDTVGVVFDMFDGAVLHESVMSLNADGTVTIPVDVPGIQGKLDLNDDLVFTSKAKGIYTTGGGSKKALIVPDSGGKLWVGSTDDNFVSGEAAVAANGKVSLVTYEPGKGYTAAIEAGVRDISVARNLLVGENYEVKVGGDLTVEGALKLTGALAMDSLNLSDTLTTRKLTVTGDTNMAAVTMDGILTLNRALTIAGGEGIICGSTKLLTYINNNLRFGSTSNPESPQQINMIASSQINFGIGAIDILKIDANAIDAYNKTIKTTGTIEAYALNVTNFSPGNVAATSTVSAPNIVADKNLRSLGGLAVTGSSTLGKLTSEFTRTSTFHVGGTDSSVSTPTANAHFHGDIFLYPVNAQTVSFKGIIEATNTSLYISAVPTAGSTASRIDAIDITVGNGNVNMPYGASIGRGLNVSGGATVNGVLNAYNGMGVSGGDLISNGKFIARNGCELNYGSKVGLIVDSSGYVKSYSIYDTTTGQGGNVYISQSGTLMRSTSSRRFKTNIKSADMAEAMDTLRRLKVRNFTSKCECDDQSKVRTGGIAEEFHEVDSRLAVVDDEGVVQAIDTNEVLYRLLAGFQALDKRLSELEA